MNGNVREWLQETAFNQGFRGQMGGDFTSGFNANPNFVFGLDPGFVNFQTPTIETADVGFRFASSVQAVPEPGSVAFVALAALRGLVAALRRRK